MDAALWKQVLADLDAKLGFSLSRKDNPDIRIPSFGNAYLPQPTSLQFNTLGLYGGTQTPACRHSHILDACTD